MYTENQIRQYMATPLDLHIFDSLPSTNTALKVMAEIGAPEGTVLLAREQTAGRGRMGHSFYSPKDSGIYMSILLRPAIPLQESLRITTTAAVCVAEAIEETTHLPARIKWVNDVFCHGKKVCGILTEGKPNPDGTLAYVVLGVGINLFQPQDGFPEEINHIAGAVTTSSEHDLQSRWIACFLDKFFLYYNDLCQSELLDKYRERSLLQSKYVSVIGHPEQSGQVIGIDENYRLLVKTDDKTVLRLDSGEVSIRQNA